MKGGLGVGLDALDHRGEAVGALLGEVACKAELAQHLAGIEQAERVLDLPARSGRAVLGLALHALARHYGLAEATRRDGITGWGLDGYSPALNRGKV